MQYTPLQAYELIDNELHRDDAPDWSGYLHLNETNAKALAVLVDNELCLDSASLVSEGGEIEHSLLALDSDPLQPVRCGCKLYLELESSSIKRKHIIQKNWAELLQFENAIIDPYDAIYFTDDQVLVDASKDDSSFRAYKSITKVCSLLSQISDTKISDTEHVFIFGHALTIRFSVTEDSLKHELDTSVLDELLSKDLNSEAKASLVKEALVRFLKSIKEEDRFDSLISKFHGFSTELLISYEQFLKNYTFDKVRKEYQEKKTDYISRINKVFDDVATKTLAVPAGIWFAMNQIKPGEVDSLQYAKNCSTLLICLLLVYLVIANLLGQLGVLKSLKKEYTDLFKRIKTEYEDKISYDDAQEGTKAEIDKDIENINLALKELDSREHSVFCKLTGTAVLILVVCIAVFTLVMTSNVPTS